MNILDEFDKIPENIKKEYFIIEKNLEKKRVNSNLLKKAFYFNYIYNNDSKRLSGDYSYIHNIEVSKIVCQVIHLDDISVIVSLIYDLPNRNLQIKLNTIEKEFGKSIVLIVEGLQKIKTLEKDRALEEQQLENFRKLIISLTTDIRIILVKLAIRLHNMRTLEFLPIQDQKEISFETMEVYVPFANRFGLRNIKWELEDLSFKFTNRDAYYEIKNKLFESRTQRESYVEQFIKPVELEMKNAPLIKSNKINFEISGRVKHIYSIYNKMRLRGKPMDELYDLTAIRVILDYNDPLVCFYVYGLIGSIYQPLPDTFNDYINTPKKNGYQSIHVAVLGPQRKPVEVQIRTLKMHYFAEEGIASHFNYKRGLLPAKSVFDDAHVQQWLDSVKDIFENRHHLSSNQLLDSLKKNLFFEEIYVFTPTNQMLIFPKDSTPLDFAFEIHTDVGLKCHICKVNGQIVPFDYKLHSGDQVEIITSKTQHPSSEWLKYVITPKAKSVINRYLKFRKKDDIAEGRKKWENTLLNNKIHLTDMEFKQIYNYLNFREKDKFYYSVYKNEIDLQKAIDFIKYKIDYGFTQSNISKNNLTPGFITSFIIMGTLREDIIIDILSSINRVNAFDYNSVQYEELENRYEAKIKLTNKVNYDIRKLINRLYEINGVASVRLIKES